MKSEKVARPRLALFGVGILGGGPQGEGVPMLAELFVRLSKHYEIAASLLLG